MPMEEGSKQPEAALAARLDLLLSATPTAMYTCAPVPPYAATFISSNITRILGYSAEQFLAVPSFWEHHVHPDDAGWVLADLPGALARGHHEREYRFRHADGSWRWIRNELRVVRGSDGTIAEIVGSFSDITERRQAEEALREREERYRTLFESNPIPMWVYDLETLAFLTVNDAAVAHYGYTREDFLGMTIADIRPAEDIERLLRNIAQVKDHHLDKAGVWRHRRKDGSIIEVEISSHVLTYQGRRAELVLVNDITERRRLERQYLRAQRLESVGTLASGIAHDLNNILSPVILGMELLRPLAKDPQTRSTLTLMLEGAQRGRDTVRQLLTFARGADMEKSPVQLPALLKEIVRLLRQTFPKNIQICCDSASEIPPVLADASQIHQVLVNLCVNARDAMPEGGVLRLELENRALDEAGARVHPKARPIAYVVLKVSDSGVGIAPEILEHVFDPFFTTKPQGTGTGLGLATALGIVEGHGGFVLVESKVEKGTSFQVYLPASRADEKTVAAPEANETGRGSGELILIVDDEPAVAQSAELTLRHQGYSTLTASSMAEALLLHQANRDRIRVVLTDIMMPMGDGRSLIGLLVEQHPGLPVIAMSGLSTADLQRETLRRGARAYLAKPFTTQQLLQSIHKVLQNAGS